ncbi:MAG: 30S ribosomal protein S18 [Chloroflexi bacterium]|nr:30S ribosomal protein S18 [Chloroflexota bacterium]
MTTQQQTPAHPPQAEHLAPRGPRAGGPPGAGPARRPGGGRRGKFFPPRRKICVFCVEKNAVADYKNVSLLRRFLSDRAKILPRQQTGVCAKHQRQLGLAIKRARVLALLPLTHGHILGMGGTERFGGPPHPERERRAVAPAPVPQQTPAAEAEQTPSPTTETQAAPAPESAEPVES